MAKKKKDVSSKKVAIDEVIEEKDTVKENFVDLMKEVSMQEEVNHPIDEVEEQKNDIVEVNESEKVMDDILVVDNKERKDVFEDLIADNIVELVKAEQISEKIDSILENISVDKVIEDTKNNNDTKPRMTYRQMMGYDWNGQNFDYV